MNWLTLTLASWREHTLRTVISAAGVAIAVAALYSLLSFNRGYQQGIRSELDRLGAHVLLVPKGCPYDAASMALHGASWPCYLKQAYLKEVLSVPGIAAAAPAFMTALQASNSVQVVYVGVEKNILSLKPAWHITGSFPSSKNDVLLGAGAQAKYGGQIGHQIRLPGLRGQEVIGNISGVAAPTHGSEDDFIYMRLSDAQALFHHPNELTHVLLRLKDPDKLDEVTAQLRGCDAGLAMNVVPLAHVFQTIQTVVNSTRLLLACIALIAFFVAGTGVSNTVMMSVAERTREIGVMRAIGASPGHVYALVWLETVQVCIAGALCGQAGGILFSPAVESWARSRLPFSPAGTLISWDWQLVALGFISALVLGTIAALLPASRAAHMPPVRAIRARELFA